MERKNKTVYQANEMTNQQLWQHIKTQYPDLAKFIQELKKAGLEPGRPVIYDRK